MLDVRDSARTAADAAAAATVGAHQLRLSSQCHSSFQVLALFGVTTRSSRIATRPPRRRGGQVHTRLISEAMRTEWYTGPGLQWHVGSCADRPALCPEARFWLVLPVWMLVMITVQGSVLCLRAGRTFSRVSDHSSSPAGSAASGPGVTGASAAVFGGRCPSRQSESESPEA
jgi:hypothetical protein